MAEGLTPAQIESFIDDGFVHVEGAFARSDAEEGRALLWQEMGLDPDDPTQWTESVIRLGGSGAPPFDRAVNTPVLHRCFDQLVGPGRWAPRWSLGTFPVRFPNRPEPDDTGWHTDGSFGDWPYRLNLHSWGRRLLMLFLFSDVGPDDAPTRIRVGSHLDIPPILAPAGADGLSFIELGLLLAPTEARPVVTATGSAGDVYLCHPFLVHAAQAHRGQVPRFIAQPELPPTEPLDLDRADGDYSPVEIAIRRGLGLP